MSDDLHYLTIAQAGERLRNGELSPVDLVEACLRRIEALEGRLHAFITLTADAARDAARRAEAEIRAGRWRGPLHGIPIAHKDIVTTRGVRTTAHSNLLRDWVPDTDATVYARLEQAGAISLGKLSLWEFAYGNPGPDVAFPAARNPWNTGYSPGGSSSGSGAGVAAGFFPGATGTDTGGSIRHPSAVCGIVGMKPTFGRVSVNGVLPLAASYDHVGPMTRTVRDNALMLQAMAGHDPADPTSLRDPVPDFGRLIGTSLAGLKLGVPRGFMTESNPHDADCLAAFDEALRVLLGLGAQTVEFDFPDFSRRVDLGTRITVAEAYAWHRENLERTPEKYDRSFRERVLVAATQTEEELCEAQAARAQFRREYDDLFASGIDAIVSAGREGISDSMEQLATNSGRRGSCTRMYNMTGLPALVMPMGFGAHGLPLGLQIAANRLAEDRVYQIAAAYEAATPWHLQRPPL